MTTNISSFTIRVYGICIENNKVLVTDEYIKGHYVTKFPGGGLELGEGTLDCLKRELIEETGQEIEVLEHIYTTDYFQVSIFNPAKQVISIYYRFRFTAPVAFPLKDKVFDFEELKEGVQTFRWINLNDLKKEDLTLPIDQKVVEMIKNIV